VRRRTGDLADGAVAVRCSGAGTALYDALAAGRVAAKPLAEQGVHGTRGNFRALAADRAVPLAELPTDHIAVQVRVRVTPATTRMRVTTSLPSPSSPGAWTLAMTS
jgi:hypothetical protein